jgi:hypothetical protein
MADERDVILRGAALRAAVRAAETPLLGDVVKRNLAAQLGLNELFELDLSEYDPEPAALPHHPAQSDDD